MSACLLRYQFSVICLIIAVYQIGEKRISMCIIILHEVPVFFFFELKKKEISNEMKLN